jgi:hypothetical protein
MNFVVPANVARLATIRIVDSQNLRVSIDKEVFMWLPYELGGRGRSWRTHASASESSAGRVQREPPAPVRA